MTDIVERLHTIRAHLQTGALGQREVWEEWLTEAAKPRSSGCGRTTPKCAN